jgi:hypothetical protein
VDTADQLADIFTKSLQPRLHAHCLSALLRRPWVSNLVREVAPHEGVR